MPKLWTCMTAKINKHICNAHRLVAYLLHFLSRSFLSAPTTLSICWPSLMNKKVGIARTSYSAATSCTCGMGNARNSWITILIDLETRWISRKRQIASQSQELREVVYWSTFTRRQWVPELHQHPPSQKLVVQTSCSTLQRREPWVCKVRTKMLWSPPQSGPQKKQRASKLASSFYKVTPKTPLTSWPNMSNAYRGGIHAIIFFINMFIP